MVLLWRLSSQWRAENCKATARTSVLLILGLCPAISLWLSIMNNWPLSQFLLILPSAVSSHLAISDKLRNPEPNTTNNSDWSRAELLRLGSISSGDSLSYEVCSYMFLGHTLSSLKSALICQHLSFILSWLQHRVTIRSCYNSSPPTLGTAARSDRLRNRDLSLIQATSRRIYGNVHSSQSDLMFFSSLLIR